MAGYLQARGVNNLISGGYTGEIVTADTAWRNWTDIEEEGSVDSYYTYRDSNTEQNSRSSETTITIRTTWKATLDAENVVHINTKTYIVDVTRNPYPEGSSGPTGSLKRDIYVFRPGTCGVSQSKWTVKDIPVWHSGRIYGVPAFPAFIYENNYTLAPGKESGTQSAIVVRGLVSGYTGYLCVNYTNKWLDALEMGFQFRNNLPTDLPIPVHTGTAQTPDICENQVQADLTFEAPPIEGAELYLEYRYEGQGWSEDRSVSRLASRGMPVTVSLYNLIPTNHTKEPVIVYWRAKYRPVTVKMVESDWAYGQTQVMYVPAPNMTVPDITAMECSAITRGDYIEPWTEEQCYNEFSCADQEDLRGQIEAKNDEENRECRITNGVATEEDLKGDKS